MEIEMFIAELEYTAPLSKIDQHLTEHRAWLDTQYAKGNFLLSGPKNPRIGGIIISPLQSREELEQLLTHDPSSIHQLVTYTITEFRAVKVHPELQKYIES